MTVHEPEPAERAAKAAETARDLAAEAAEAAEEARSAAEKASDTPEESGSFSVFESYGPAGHDTDAADIDLSSGGGAESGGPD